MRRRAAAALLAGAVPTATQAHSFGTPYILPVPLWMYGYGCAATLFVTFALLAWFRHEPVTPVSEQTPESWRIAPALLWLLRAMAMALLALTIWAGLAGVDDPNRNIAMTLFWVVFLLGLAWFTLLAGDVYSYTNPWASAVDLLERAGINLSAKRLPYPERLGCWPALLLYFALIYLELFTAATPELLAQALLVYTGITLAGVGLFGKRVWFDKGDLFAVYFRLFGILAPIAWRRDEDGRWTVRLRSPLRGALDETPGEIGMVLVVLFMLSSTAFDSIHETALWVGLYWTNTLELLLPLWDGDLGRAQTALMEGYRIYRWLGLLVFPLGYVALYWASLAIGRKLAPTVPPAGEAVRLFCNALLPIAIAYNFAHYFAFAVAQSASLPALLADPLGTSIARPTPVPALPMGVIWHLQVGAILLGHVASVWLAHLMALRATPEGRGAVISQLPLLVLMVAYTIFGLWILSLPLG